MQPPKRYSLIENNVRATVLKGAEVGEGEREEMKGVRFPNNDTLKDVPVLYGFPLSPTIRRHVHRRYSAQCFAWQARIHRRQQQQKT